MTALLVAFAFAIPPCRAVQVDDEPEFHFTSEWTLEHRDPEAVAMVSVRGGHDDTDYVFKARSPGPTALVFQHVAQPGARHVLVLFISPRKAGKP